ncbi:MAG: RNA polymerase sigma factor [Lachnospiraceae bacterium]|nr:RNA polymerase sigma factor [Lachnospiraceae bacterium]
MDEDFLLVLGIRNGKEDATERFVRKYYSEILNYCFAKTGDFMQAEDITQQTFLNFFKSIGRYEHRGKAKNFLYVTAGNLCKNFYEQKGRSKEIPLSEEEGNGLTDERSRDFAGETAEKISIREALLQLSDEQREAVLLYYFQELKIKEIAAILGQTQSNIKYRLKAAKEKLKEILGKEDFT